MSSYSRSPLYAEPVRQRCTNCQSRELYLSRRTRLEKLLTMEVKRCRVCLRRHYVAGSVLIPSLSQRLPQHYRAKFRQGSGEGTVSQLQMDRRGRCITMRNTIVHDFARNVYCQQQELNIQQ
jgi:hypothetical protein